MRIERGIVQGFLGPLCLVGKAESGGIGDWGLGVGDWGLGGGGIWAPAFAGEQVRVPGAWGNRRVPGEVVASH
jgi:hypothetical protein